LARYSTKFYDTFFYGEGFNAGLIVEPFVALTLDYNIVKISYTRPGGFFSRFRIVRNQEGIPETAEDGVIIIDEGYTGEVFSEIRSFRDGVDNTVGDVQLFAEGRFVYYAAWVLLDDGWFLCGVTDTLIPRKHAEILEDGTELADSHTKFLSLIPRAYLSDRFNPVDEINYSSDLARFLYGFSFTIDELLTYLDLLLPDHTQLNLSLEQLEAKALELGIPAETRPSTKFQRRLVRDALQLYAEKGTPEGIRKFVRDLTGFETQVDTSPNLLLSIQDSSFVGSVGSWKPYGDCTISAVRSIVPPEDENSIDKIFTAKVVVQDEYARIATGLIKPLLSGVPVSEGEAYIFSFSHTYGPEEAGVSVSGSLRWYDFRGTLIESEEMEEPVESTDEWVRTAFEFVAPEGAVKAALEIKFYGTGTVYLDLIQLAESPESELDEEEEEEVIDDKYYEPRQAIITLFPTKKNLITNPSFEEFVEPEEEAPYGEFTGWEINAANVEQEFYGEEEDEPVGVLNPGLSFAKITTNDNELTEISTAIEPREDECFWYTFSFYARCPDDIIPATISLTIEDDDDEPSAPPSVFEKNIAVTDEWQRFSMTACVSGLYLDEKITAKISGNTLGQILYLDMAQIEPITRPSDYFDGSHATVGAEWVGEEHESETHLYENRIFKLNRLRKELKNFLSFNTPYVVKTLTSTEFSGVS